MTHDWDAQYGEEQMWSGNPNQALVDEVSGLAPGTALDIGCGEGADAIWLADRGWRVTGLDPSGKALERARVAAGERPIEWLHSGIEDAALATYDLVTACYPAVLKGAEWRFIEAVAPGGTLLFVHHAEFDRARAEEHGFDPDDYVQAEDIAAALPPGWSLERREQRERHVTHGAGAHHTTDLVLRARRGNA